DVDPAVAAELKALRKVKKDYERLKLEHDLLKKPSGSLRLERRHLRLHRAPPGNAPGEDDVPGAGRQRRGLLRLGLRGVVAAALPVIAAPRSHGISLRHTHPHKEEG